MVQIAKDIYWIGAVDWDLRNFHGYSTPQGSTYNAYLLLDEVPTLIDTVKHYCVEEMVRRVKERIDPARIRYIVSNHTEMDHSGGIAALLKLAPEAVVVCSPKGKEGLSRHFKAPWKFKVVNTGETLSIGRRTLRFHLMPMVHWPDSMATYLEPEKILFSNDAFGQHYASAERFADEAGSDIALREAAKYYANIVMPYADPVCKVLEALKTVPMEMICPSHGLIWRKPDDRSAIISRYDAWAHYRTERRAVIVYDSMWHTTEMMAKRLYESCERAGIPATIYPLRETHISDVIAEVLRSGIVLVGTPMLNNHMLPTVGAFMTYLKGLKPKKRIGATFGSYGWSTAGFKELEAAMQESGIELAANGVYLQWIPEAAELNSLDSVIATIQSRSATSS